MPKLIKPLSDSQIKNAKPKEKEYLLSDGGGLHLRVKPNGSKSWLFNYCRQFTSKRTNLGLGSYPEISLAQARAMREEYRALLAQGIDPKFEKERQRQEAESAIQDTFLSVAESYFTGIYQQKAKNEETRLKNWKRLEKYILPYIGNKHISTIKVKELVTIYEQAESHSNTLKKLHQIVVAIMDHAITKGLIDSHNCKLAIKSFHLKSTTPHPTIKIEELGQLFADLNKANISRQTYLLICWSFLTAVRPNEAVNAQWSEIDFKNSLWHIPKERMKGQADKKRPHIVPLSRQALLLLEQMKPISGNYRYIFKGRTAEDKPMNKETVNTALKRNGYKDRLTAHGIRAFIKTFLASRRIDRNVSETVLAHLLEGGDDLENTYNRYDYLNERIPIMQLIADFCEQNGMKIS